MSVFTNPARGSIENARTYVAAVLDLVGNRDPLDVLRATPAALERTVNTLSPEQIRKPEAPGKWAIRDVLQHIADSELVWAYRVRLVLAQERPALTGYDQDLWSQRLAYDKANPREAIDEFQILRRANLRLIERASPADLKRVGVHAERGDESLEHMIRLYAGHDLLHLRQIERIAGTG